MRTQREDDRGLKGEIGEDEQVLGGLEGRLQSIRLHTSSTGTANCLKTRHPWSKDAPVFVSGNGLLPMQLEKGPPPFTTGQIPLAMPWRWGGGQRFSPAPKPQVSEEGM